MSVREIPLEADHIPKVDDSDLAYLYSDQQTPVPMNRKFGI